MIEKTLGKKIKRARLDLRLTQQDLAGDFITRNMLSKIESGAATPSLKTLQYLAQKLNKSISYFLDTDLEKGQYIDQDSRACFEHASFLIKNNEYDKCSAYINQILKTIDDDPTNKFYGFLLYLLTKCNIRLGNYDLIEHHLDKAIAILESTLELNKDNYYLAEAYFYKFNIFFYKKKYDESELYIRKAIYSFDNSYVADVLLEIKLLFSLGFVLYKLNKYKEAIEILNHVLDFSKNSRCYYSLGDTYMLLGILHKKMRVMDLAINYTKKATLFFDSVDQLDSKAACEKNLGNYYLFTTSYDCADKYLNRSLDYYQSINNTNKVNTIKSDLQELLVKKGEYTDAIKYLKEINLDSLETVELSRVYLNLGNSYLGLKDYTAAEKNLKKAENLLKDSNYFDILQIIYDSYSNMYSQLKDYEKAFTYSQESKRFLELSLNE